MCNVVSIATMVMAYYYANIGIGTVVYVNVVIWKFRIRAHPLTLAFSFEMNFSLSPVSLLYFTLKVTFFSELSLYIITMFRPKPSVSAITFLSQKSHADTCCDELI